MATTTTFYNSFYTDLGNGDIDLDGDTFKMALCTSTYTPDIDAHDRFDDITNEVVGAGYTAGGETLTSVTWTQDNANDRTLWDADNVEWTSSTITARYGILYKDSGVDSTSPLVCYLDFGGDQSSSGAVFRITFNATGIAALQQG